MTKNNLREHLSWLLKSATTNSPRSTSSRTLETVALLETSIEPGSSANTASSSVLSTNICGRSNNASAFDTEPEFARPQLPASVLRAQSKDDMARLQSGPRSSHKPQLMSEATPASLQTRPRSSTRVPGNSLAAQYNLGLNETEKTKVGSTNTKYHQLDTPTTASNITRSPIIAEPTSLDLSRDIDFHTSSSSTVEGFGEPRTIWREQSAIRIEPVRSIGRKRKSDELELDELQCEVPSRLSQGSFANIDDFKDEITFPRKLKKSPQTSELQENAKCSDSSPGVSEVIATSHPFVDDLDSPNTLGRHSASEKLQSSSTLRDSSGHIAQKSSAIIGNEDTRLKQTSLPRKVAVADSEDDDDETEYVAHQRTVKQELEGTPLPHSTSTCLAGKHEPSPSKSELKLEEVPLDDPSLRPGRQQDPVPRTSSDASPFQRDSPTKILERFTASQPLTSPGASPATQNQVKNPRVESFLALHPDCTQVYLDYLHLSRKAAAETMYNYNLEGAPIPQDLQSKPASLSVKISAVEQLVSLRDEYLRLGVQMEQRKGPIIKAIETMPMETVLALPHFQQDFLENKKASHRLSKIKVNIARWLVDADLPNNTLSLSHDSISSERVITQVKSTQALQHLQQHARSIEQLPISSDSTATHIQQTQAVNKDPQTPKRKVHDADANPRRSPLRTYTSSTATKDVTDYFSPSKHRRYPQNDRRRSSSIESKPMKTSLTAQQEAAKSDYGFDDDEDLFTTHLNNNLEDAYDNDDYGQDDDDVDMLEMAEELETQPFKSVPKRTVETRSAFAETTGNIMRTEASKAAPAFEPSSPKSSLLQHRWSRDVKAAMHQSFHLRGFRPFQLEAINATLAGKDAFVLMPTGGGKSLCYQLPAIITSGKTQGVTVVISPLLSLMQDQVEHLQQLRIQALLINGEVTAEHRRLVMGCLREQDPQKFCQLLYITPEMISKSQAMVKVFKDLHQRGKLARIVIDEAHCVSQWGHDFRPDYKMLGEVRRQFRGIPVIALTATATENVKVDVMHNLGMDTCEIFTQSFNRPNLHYEVRSKGRAKEVLQSMADTINTIYRRQSGIIYCLSKKNCEDIAAKLRAEHGIKAHHYHAGMEAEEKKEVQKKWQAGQYNVIVATIAFGMGIDKPDVRFVFHNTIPKSLEGYYQETGRAGRDGKVSGCFLYYGYQDTSALKRMIDDGEGSYEQKERQRQMLRNVIHFCENKSDCRRVQVLNYFGEAFSKEKCNASCDNCKSSSRFESQDFSRYVPVALSLVGKVERDNVTLLHCVDVFRGSRNKKISDLGHDRLPEYGAGADIDRGNVDRLFYRLLSEDALAEHNKVNKVGFASSYVHLGKNSNEFSRGRKKLYLQVCLSPVAKVITTKGTSRKKSPTKKGPHAAPAFPDYPASTNVSSPIQAKSRRRAPQRKPSTSIRGLDEENSSDDNFVVGDDEMEETQDDTDDGFEPPREAGKPRSKGKRRPGPPITIDEKMASLSDNHRAVVEDFLFHAKRKVDKLKLDNSLRAVPFTDTILREMAIDFPRNSSEMLKIPGIEPEKVNHWGSQFLILIRNAKQRYEAMMDQENRPQDPNHQNVINIISDEEDLGGGDALDDLEDDDESQGQRSQYFQHDDPEVQAFNARLVQQSQLPSRAQSKSHEDKSKKTSNGGGGQGGFKKKKHRRSSGAGKGRGPTGVTKKDSAHKKSSSRSNSTFGAPRSGGGAAGGGIGMMPM